MVIQFVLYRTAPVAPTGQEKTCPIPGRWRESGAPTHISIVQAPQSTCEQYLTFRAKSTAVCQDNAASFRAHSRYTPTPAPRIETIIPHHRTLSLNQWSAISQWRHFDNHRNGRDGRRSQSMQYLRPNGTETSRGETQNPILQYFDVLEQCDRFAIERFQAGHSAKSPRTRHCLMTQVVQGTQTRVKIWRPHSWTRQLSRHSDPTPARGHLILTR